MYVFGIEPVLLTGAKIEIHLSSSGLGIFTINCSPSASFTNSIFGCSSKDRLMPHPNMHFMDFMKHYD